MPDETHLVSDKLFITDDLHIKENEEFITLLDFVHKHSIINLKFPSEVGVDEDDYDTQAEVVAALETYLKSSSATPEELKSIWLLKRKDGKETTDDTRDEFYYNEEEEHLERIGSTKIDFSDITDDVTFKASVTFQTPDGKNVTFVKSPLVNNNRMMDVSDVQQTVSGGSSSLPPSSGAVISYVQGEKLKLVQEEVTAQEVYVGPNSNLTVGPSNATFKTPIKLNSTGATQSPAGTLSNDDGVLKWNGEEVGGTLTINDNNQGKYYPKTKQVGFQGGYVAMTKDDTTGEVKLFIRENKDFKYPKSTVLTSSYSSGYIYSSIQGSSYYLPSGKSSGSSYDLCLEYKSSDFLYYQFKDENGNNPIKFDIDPEQLESTEIIIKIYSGDYLQNTVSMPLSQVVVSLNPTLGSDQQFKVYTSSAPQKVWREAYSTDAEYERVVNDEGKTPYTIQYKDLYIKARQSIVTNGGSLRFELYQEGESGEVAMVSGSNAADAYLYKKLSGYPTISCSLRTGSVPVNKYISGVAYKDIGTPYEATASIRDSQYYYNVNANCGYIDLSQFGVSGTTLIPPVNPPTQTVTLTKQFTLGSGQYGAYLLAKVAVYSQTEYGRVSSWASAVVNGPFWSKTSSDNGLVEDFWGETSGRTNYPRKTDTNGTWNSQTDLNTRQGSYLGLKVLYGHLVYPSEGTQPSEGRTFYRWFKGSGDATLNQFNITVKGLPQNHFNENKTVISIKYGNSFYRLNQLQANGGLALSVPTNNKWKCGYLPSMTSHPSVGEGFFLMIQSTDTNLNIEGPITIEMNPA